MYILLYILFYTNVEQGSLVRGISNEEFIKDTKILLCGVDRGVPDLPDTAELLYGRHE